MTHRAAASAAAKVTGAAAKKLGAVHIVLQHPGWLGEYGYAHVAALTESVRRAALRRAAADHGWGRIVKRLNVLYIFNKNRRPDLAAVFRADRNYASAKLKDAKGDTFQ